MTRPASGSTLHPWTRSSVRLFPYAFAPRGWAFCNGQILSISQNTALFALIGTIYGGDGRTTFALPDLRGRVAVSSGQGLGPSTYDVGAVGGAESVSLTETEMPTHQHQMSVNGMSGGFTSPNNRYIGRVAGGTAYAGVPNDKTLNRGAIAPAGGGQPHENRPPHLTLNYCIALEGIFPGTRLNPPAGRVNVRVRPLDLAPRLGRPYSRDRLRQPAARSRSGNGECRIALSSVTIDAHTGGPVGNASTDIGTAEG